MSSPENYLWQIYILQPFLATFSPTVCLGYKDSQPHLGFSWRLHSLDIDMYHYHRVADTRGGVDPDTLRQSILPDIVRFSKKFLFYILRTDPTFYLNMDPDPTLTPGSATLYYRAQQT